MTTAAAAKINIVKYNIKYNKIRAIIMAYNYDSNIWL